MTADEDRRFAEIVAELVPRLSAEQRRELLTLLVGFVPTAVQNIGLEFLGEREPDDGVPDRDGLFRAIAALAPMEHRELLAFLVGFAPTAVEVALANLHAERYDPAAPMPDTAPARPAAELVATRVVRVRDDRAVPLVGQIVARLDGARVRVVWGSISTEEHTADLVEWHLTTGSPGVLCPDSVACRRQCARACWRVLHGRPAPATDWPDSIHVAHQAAAHAPDPTQLDCPPHPSKLAADLGDLIEALRFADVEAGLPACTKCGCTENGACPGGCAWASMDPPTCTRCA